MTCPWCGAPVRVYGSRWECGYCGDSGFLNSGKINSNYNVNISKVSKPKPSNTGNILSIFVYGCLIFAALTIFITSFFY